MKDILLFTRRFQGETYTFYHHAGVGCLGLYTEYFSVETPENCFGYSDTILFNNGEPYTLYRRLPNWILRECKKALEKRGYNVKKGVLYD